MQRSSNLSDRVIVIVLCGGAARHQGVQWQCTFASSKFLVSERPRDLSELTTPKMALKSGRTEARVTSNLKIITGTDGLVFFGVLLTMFGPI